MRRKQWKKGLVMTLTAALLLASAPGAFQVSAKAKPALSKRKLTLKVGQSKRLTLKRAKGKIKWSSKKPGIASVSRKGKVAAKAPGRTVIVAKNRGKKYRCRVLVKAKNPGFVTSSPNSTSYVSSTVPSSSARPGGSTAPGGSARPGNSTVPGSSAVPGSSIKPVGSMVPGGSEKPGNSTAPEGSTAPGSSTVPGGSAAPEDSTVPGESMAPSSSMEPSSSMAPSSSTEPGSSMAPSSSPDITSSPTEEPEETDPPAEKGALKSGEHLLSNGEGLTINAVDDYGRYSFKLGQTKQEIVTGFGEPRRIDTLPQGYEAYIYRGDSYSTYFQIYFDQDIVVGGAVIGRDFDYQATGGTMVVSGGDALPSNSYGPNSLGSYNYQDAKYYDDGNAYVLAFVENVAKELPTVKEWKGKVYGIQFFCKTNGSGGTVSLSDMLKADTIVKKNGYDSLPIDAQNSQALELEEWAKAYRFFSFYGDIIGDGMQVQDPTTGKWITQDKINHEKYAYVEENEDFIKQSALAQIHAKYGMQNDCSNSTSDAELKALEALGLNIPSKTVNDRLQYGYYQLMNNNTDNAYVNEDDDRCITYGELGMTRSPDAIGALTWVLDSGNSDGYVGAHNILRNYKDSEGHELLPPAISSGLDSMRIVGGFAYNSTDKKNYTYAVIDVFCCGDF